MNDAEILSADASCTLARYAILRSVGSPFACERETPPEELDILIADFVLTQPIAAIAPDKPGFVERVLAHYDKPDAGTMDAAVDRVARAFAPVNGAVEGLPAEKKTTAQRATAFFRRCFWPGSNADGPPPKP